MKFILFDFDKTLTFKDSLTQLFLERINGINFMYFPLFILLKFLSKVKFISVKKEKEILIKLLLPKDRNLLEDLFDLFAEKIKLTPIIVDILNTEKEAGNRVIILTAAPEYYVNKIFPDIEVYGTTFFFNEKFKFISIDSHPFGIEKIYILKNLGINRINEMYYDSKNDEVLCSLCLLSHKVKRGKIIELKENENFNI
jgi:HAD superfamily phosphoserine phosphatase-like hydrolase